MISSSMQFGGALLSFDSEILRFPAWRNCADIPGASNYWDRCGSIGGYFSDINPTVAATYARAGLYQLATADATLSVTWPGIHLAGNSGPLMCVTPDATEFGLHFIYDLDTSQWALWEIGKQSTDKTLLGSAAGSHSDGVSVVLSAEVVGNQITCKADGVTKITATIPAALYGSSLHGIAVDIKSVTRTPNLQSLASPYSLSLDARKWLEADGVWDDGAYWLDTSTWVNP